MKSNENKPFRNISFTVTLEDIDKNSSYDYKVRKNIFVISTLFLDLSFSRLIFFLLKSIVTNHTFILQWKLLRELYSINDFHHAVYLGFILHLYLFFFKLFKTLTTWRKWKIIFTKFILFKISDSEIPKKLRRRWMYFLKNYFIKKINIWYL